jgi:hypothetical protein
MRKKIVIPVGAVHRAKPQLDLKVFERGSTPVAHELPT